MTIVRPSSTGFICQTNKAKTGERHDQDSENPDGEPDRHRNGDHGDGGAGRGHGGNRQAGAKIDRHIFGQFAEHLGTGIYDGIWVGRDSKIPNVRGIRTDVVTALKAIHVPDVRWPGGCYADDYHWRKAIGDPSKRPTTGQLSVGRVPESNQFGTHEYFDFLDQIGSEAYVSGNVGSGTPQEMSDWLEYMTADPAISSLGAERASNGHPAPFKVPFFGVGNESWGCGGSMTPEHYADVYRNYATFARNYDNAQQLPNGDYVPNGMKRISSGPMSTIITGPR